MSETYKERIDSPIYGTRLIIYRRKDQQNDNYIFRAKIEGKSGYIRRSTKTADPQEAIRLAHEAYDELRVRQLGGRPLHKITVEKFFDKWIEETGHRFSKQRKDWKRAYFQRYLKDYFGAVEVGDLDKIFVEKYWAYRLNFWNTNEGKTRIEINTQRANAKTKSSHNVAKEPAYATLRAEASLINEILRAAVDEGHLKRTIKISAQTAVDKTKRRVGVRATFTPHEWKVLSRNLYSYAWCLGRFKDQRVHSLHRFQRRMLHAFVLLASYIGLRVGEQKHLVWGDLDTINRDGKTHLVVRVRGETSKVGEDRAAIARHPAEKGETHILKVMGKFREISPRNGPNDLIFFSEKDGDISPADLSVSFKSFLKRVQYEGREEGLRLSADGKPRTLYSLRHFYAIDRLTHGTDVFRLATSMGTGVQQIRKHYGKHISGDAFITDLTRYESKGGEKAKTKAVKDIVDMVHSGTFNEDLALEAIRNVMRNRLS
ncbi:MAG: hypothetical protein O2817_12855 [Proteobacteria bacterium]|nr:hypothetical protein [Pseudomonadota bacterium]